MLTRFKQICRKVTLPGAQCQPAPHLSSTGIFYLNKEISLHELILSGSDALNQTHHSSPTDPHQIEPESKPYIRITLDKANRHLLIHDTPEGTVPGLLPRIFLVMLPHFPTQMNNSDTPNNTCYSLLTDPSQLETELNLIINTYSINEIFLHELISSDSNTLIEIRYSSLADPGQLESDSGLYIHITLDEANARCMQATTKHIGDEQYIWESAGGHTFTITPNASLSCASEMCLYLKEDQLEYLKENVITKEVETVCTLILD